MDSDGKYIPANKSQVVAWLAKMVDAKKIIEQLGGLKQ
jgi:hypothetical protein